MKSHIGIYMTLGKGATFFSHTRTPHTYNNNRPRQQKYNSTSIEWKTQHINVQYFFIADKIKKAKSK